MAVAMSPALSGADALELAGHRERLLEPAQRIQVDALEHLLAPAPPSWSRMMPPSASRPSS
jgi:hypothetical protein